MYIHIKSHSPTEFHMSSTEPTKKNASRHSPTTVQFVARVPRDLHSSFHGTCHQLGFNASEVLRSLMESFVRMNQAEVKNG